jgi:transcription initiation factor TFIID subunit 7
VTLEEVWDIVDLNVQVSAFKFHLRGDLVTVVMAPKNRKVAASRKRKSKCDDTPSGAGAFVTLKLRPELLKVFGLSDTQVDQHLQRHRNLKLAKKSGFVPTDVHPQPPINAPGEPPEMKTRNAWVHNKANSARASPSPVAAADGAQNEGAANQRVACKRKKSGPGPRKVQVQVQVHEPPSFDDFAEYDDEDEGFSLAPARKKRKSGVHFAPKVTVIDDEGERSILDTIDTVLTASVIVADSESDSDSSSSSRSASGSGSESDSEKEDEESDREGSEGEDEEEDEVMEKPKLKLRMTSISEAAAPGASVPQTPGSIKLKISSTPTAAPSAGSPAPSEPASKKRKKKHSVSIAEQPVTHTQPAPLLKKITFKQQARAVEAGQITPITPSLKIKTKGKIPKRPLAVGYDSELDEREVDPVILEGFILRMQPGPDCDAVREAIEKGTIGVFSAQGGFRINIRFFDTQGRRGILMVRDNQYAVTMVDLPCIIEGMKSWDKKGFIKSLDISQMLLVLGPCKTDEEARSYPLPPDVDPKNHQYAHGITAPMKYVRKRRFARTKKLRLDDLEAIDRRVAAMLEADAQSLRPVKVELLDHDPRLDQDESSEEDEDEDMDADAEPDDYFDTRNAGTGQVVDTPGFVETPAEELDDDEVNEFERMFMAQDQEAAAAAAATQNGTHLNTHLAPDAGDSSFAVTSTSASPSADTGTPAMNADTPASGAATTDDDDVSDEDDDDKDDDDDDGDESAARLREQILEVEGKIKEQMDLMHIQGNAILKRKIARKITDLKIDVRTMKRSIGMPVDEDDENEGEV